jgi:hypothetical protein
MKEAILFDIDGCLANNSQRIHYLDETPKNYEAFNQEAMSDKPLKDIVFLANLLTTVYYESHQLVKLFIYSGRPEEYRHLTQQWLKLYVPRLYDVSEGILLRPKGDTRPDVDVKKDMINKLILEGYNIRFSIEDKESVCDMLVQNNITVLSPRMLHEETESSSEISEKAETEDSAE